MELQSQQRWRERHKELRGLPHLQPGQGGKAHSRGNSRHGRNPFERQGHLRRAQRKDVEIVRVV
jgi:hypothetical protein